MGWIDILCLAWIGASFTLIGLAMRIESRRS